ncbi:MAG: hypothetical protein JOZ46_07450 [Candidatus Dormibacteraeota bacterium]|nr:hypothetical protein [Candidatus Dormibacteraeota bacterium]MBV9525633.1 hypothetical protein [Candidatus Dormibacteraeota bacterium]
MIEQEDQLDSALEGLPRAIAPEIEALVDLAAEVSSALRTWRLTPAQRERIEQRAGALFEAATTPRWRRLVPQRARPALIGGAAVALAAGVGIAVAVARGRRQPHPQPA